MKKNPDIRVTRATWFNPNKWVFWNERNQVFDISINGKNTEWCWGDTMTYEDLTWTDWRLVF